MMALRDNCDSDPSTVKKTRTRTKWSHGSFILNSLLLVGTKPMLVSSTNATNSHGIMGARWLAICKLYPSLSILKQQEYKMSSLSEAESSSSCYVCIIAGMKFERLKDLLKVGQLNKSMYG